MIIAPTITSTPHNGTDNQPNVILMRLILIFVITFLFDRTIYGQSAFIDSIMARRVVDSMGSHPAVFYTPGYKQRAMQFQDIFARSSKFYEQRYHTSFHFNIAVLDSTQWVYEKFPFGYLLYDSGWVFLPAVVNESFFTNIYGLSKDSSGLSDYLQRKKCGIQQISDAVFFVYSLHELGHYFTDDVEKVSIPDMFANEMIATYFAFCYFKSCNDPVLQQLIDFSSFIKTHYHPAYRNIETMDTLYSKMTIQNFKWFHCNIVLLCQKIYDRFGLGFIDYYLQTFHTGVAKPFTTQQVIDMLDKKCDGIVNAWSIDLRSGF